MASSAYSLRLGPLRFVTALDAVVEQLGDELEAVGSSVVPSERRPRTFPLTLPVYGATSETDMREVGFRLRRQLRQLIENPSWKAQGLPLSWDVDPDLDCWLLVGGGDMDPGDMGPGFGEWKLKLTGCYIVGRPGSHRAGRRIEIADRRGALVDRAFGMVYTTDFDSTVLASKPAALPGDIEDIYSIAGIVSNTTGPSAGSPPRILFRSAAAIDGNVITYEPDRALPEPQHLLADEPGQVRLWDIGAKVTDTPIPLIPGGSGDTGQTKAGDLDPDLTYGWERIFGGNLKANRAMAIDNGVCRLRWAGSGGSRGLWIETWDLSAGYVPIAFVDPVQALWMTPREVTPERVVVEYGTRNRRCRIALQRGWWGPRLEQLRPGTNAEFTITMFNGDANAADTPTFVRAMKLSAVTTLRAAASHAAVTATSLSGAAVKWSADTALGLQVSTGTGMLSALELAGLSLEDVRSVPLLVPR